MSKERISHLQLKFLRKLNYVSGHEIKDLIQGHTDAEVLLEPEDLEIFKKLSGGDGLTTSLNGLRELNAGANPEAISDEDVAEVEDGVLIDIEGHVYESTECKNEVEYISRYHGIYGVVYKNIFYRLV